MADDRASNLPVIVTGILGGVIILAAIAILLVYISRDTWAEDNRYKLPERIRAISQVMRWTWYSRNLESGMK
jgi:hypothetical protein